MIVGTRSDPYQAFNFLVEIGGLVVGGFSDVSGLQSEVEVKDYREGGVNEYVHKLAGSTAYRFNLTLKHGMVDDMTLYNWFLDVTELKIERLNGSIILLDMAGNEVRRWVFFEAYPVKWIGPTLNAGSNNVAVEVIELVHRGLYAV